MFLIRPSNIVLQVSYKMLNNFSGVLPKLGNPAQIKVLRHEDSSVVSINNFVGEERLAASLKSMLNKGKTFENTVLMFINQLFYSYINF